MRCQPEPVVSRIWLTHLVLSAKYLGDQNQKLQCLWDENVRQVSAVLFFQTKYELYGYKAKPWQGSSLWFLIIEVDILERHCSLTQSESESRDGKFSLSVQSVSPSVRDRTLRSEIGIITSKMMDNNSLDWVGQQSCKVGDGDVNIPEGIVRMLDLSIPSWKLEYNPTFI